MQRDIRNTALYKEAESVYSQLRRPGSGLITDAAELSTNGTHAVFSGTLVESLKESSPTRICLTDLTTADTRVLTFGPNVDRAPAFDASGQRIAFLSDRHRSGDFQLYLLELAGGGARATPCVEGWVEYLHWSPDGKRVLLGVAGHGADVAGAQGAVTSQRASDEVPVWAPTVDVADETHRWRRAWVYDLVTDTVRQVSPAASNVWEAAWCGSDALVAVVSPSPGEGHWYNATLQILELADGRGRTVYEPKQQLGWPSASPSGLHVAVVEAICSDRWIVAGELRLIDTASGKVTQPATAGIDVTHTQWCSDERLLLAGHRGFESVVGLYEPASDTFTEVWASNEISCGGRYITVAPVNARGDFALLGESFTRAPEIAVVRDGKYQSVKSFAADDDSATNVVAAVERLSWKAPDGLEIQGWLLRPSGTGPFPLVMQIHGGPVWLWRPTWLGRSGLPVLMLLQRGYAVFLPNPRGSTGRGLDFVAPVVGDMGGADTYDYLSGLDYLVQRGSADPARLGVTGGSYGGFMTSWLITQDARFAAAVPVAPVTNHVTEHLLSNIPHFEALFLQDSYKNPGGKYFERSPVMHAHKTRTPTLNICGALDRCTPPEEATQFHYALLENGVESVLLTYPQEGHGIRKLPAALDYAARVVGWFEQHLGTSK